MYSEKVLDHFSNPRNVGEMQNSRPLDAALQ
jgi:NifU-like protein involved in Fe-S cluster formation